jgi:flagellar protein FlaG
MKIADVTVEAPAKALPGQQRAQQPQQQVQAAVAQVESAQAVERQSVAAQPVELHKIESVTRQIDTYLRSMNRSLQFRLDEGTGQMVVTLRDSETGEVIRQVPGEDALRIAQRIENGLSMMLDEKV